MVLDSKIAAIKAHFGIDTPEQWCSIPPEWILKVEGVGPVTLDHVRIYLAARGLTLKGDKTPEYWQQHLSATRIGHNLGDDDNGVVCPFTVIVDGQEKLPYGFEKLRTDADTGNRPLIVPWEWGHLKTGDYSVAGWEHWISVERKSLEDLYSTLGQHRDRFEREHERLADLKTAVVVIEADWNTILNSPPPRSKLRPKSVFRTAISWYQRYGVAWFAMPNRRAAEAFTFRFLERFHKERGKASVPEAAAGAI